MVFGVKKTDLKTQKNLARDDYMINTLHEMIDTDLLVPSYVRSQLTLKLLKFPY